MKTKIKKLTEAQLQNLFDDLDSLKTTSKSIDIKVLKMFHSYKPVEDKVVIKRKTQTRHTQFFFKVAFAAIILVCVLLPLYFFIFDKGIKQNIATIINKKDINATVVFLSGNINIINNNNYQNLKINSNLTQGDIVETDNYSQCSIQLGNNSIIFIKENSKVVFNKIMKSKKIKLDLLTGKILININKLPKRSNFIVETENSIVSVVGTQFLVEYDNKKKTSFIGVNRGIVKIKNKYNKYSKSIFLNANESIFIKNKNTKKHIISNNIKSIFNDIDNFKIKNLETLSSINIKTDSIPAFLTIDKKKTYKFYNEIAFFIEPGQYNIKIQDENNNKFIKNIELINNQNFYENIFFKNIIEKTIENKFRSKKIYKYTNKDDPSKNIIIGFINKDNYTIAQTNTSIVYFNNKGVKIWEKIYGTNRNLFFMSLPVIYNNNVYVSSINNKLLILDLKTGKELMIINSPGSISFGYSMLKHQEKMYFPFSSGVYSFDLNNNSFNQEPLFSVKSASIPLITKDKIYISSLMNRKLSAFDISGKKIWDFDLDNRSFITPVYIENNIYTGDKSGVIYKISNDTGILNGKKQLPAGLTSRLTKYNNTLYALTNDGILYKINPDNLFFEKIQKIDSNPSVSLYVYKFPIFKENFLIIGTNQGNINIIDLDTNKIRYRIKLSDSPIISHSHSSKDAYFVGTNEGDIFLLEYK